MGDPGRSLYCQAEFRPFACNSADTGRLTMAAPKGHKAYPGAGRPKGTQNKTTIVLRAMILGALDKAGGVNWLRKQADKNPIAFMALLARMLPHQGDTGLNSPEEFMASLLRARERVAALTINNEAIIEYGATNKS